MNIQNTLTKEQQEIVKKIDELFAEANSKGVGFVYDTSYEGELLAFNASNVAFVYGGGNLRQEDNDEEMEWGDNYAHLFDNLSFTQFNSMLQTLYVHFKPENC